MKKLLLATVLSITMISLTNAHWGSHRGEACCNNNGGGERTYETAPICTKTVMENKVIQVPKTVRVPAREVRIPQPDVIERIPQTPRRICIKQPPIPQPDIIKYECVPDKVVCKKQPDEIRFECPCGTEESNGNCCR